MHRSWIIIVVMFITSCASATDVPTLTPTPPPILPTLVTTPALAETIRNWIHDFSEENGQVPFAIEVVPDSIVLSSLENGLAELAIVAGAPPTGWFASSLGLEAISIIVHSSNPIQSISLKTLATLFTGEEDSWESLAGWQEPVQPVIPLQGDALRIHFQTRVLSSSRFTPSALLGPSPLAMIEIVASEPGAIGFVPSTQVTGEVRQIPLNGRLPTSDTLADSSYPLTLEMVATAPVEPTGEVRDFLGWLQERGEFSK